MADLDPTLISLFNPKNWGTKATPKRAESRPSQPADDTIEKRIAAFAFREFVTGYWRYIVLLTFLVLLVYFNSLGNAFVSDDKGLQLEGDNLVKWSYIFSDPLSFVRSLIYALIYQTCGLVPACFRLLNVFFHLGNTYLVFLLLFLLSGFPAALFVAGLFAVHSLLTEAVTWISGGPYSQYTFFFLLSLLCYVLIKKTPKFYLLSLLFFLIGLLSSNRVMTLFPIFYVYEFVYADLRRNWWRLLPYTVVGISWGIWYVIQIGGRVSSLQEEVYLPVGQNNLFIQIPYSITTYLEMILAPLRLTFYHSDLAFVTLDKTVWKGLGLAAFLGLLVHGLLKNRPVFFWSSFFLISLLVNMTPYRISAVVAERYVYLGTIGILAVVGLLLAKLVQKKGYEAVVYLLFFLAVCGLGIRTMVRNTDWKDSDQLMLATVKATPQSPEANNNVGAYYAKRGDYETALIYFQRVVRIYPGFADAYHNIGDVLISLKRFDEALGWEAEALRKNPKLWVSYQNIARIYFEKKDYAKALEAVGAAIQTKPADPNSYSILGAIYEASGENEKARAAYQQAKSVGTLDPRSRMLLGR